MATDKDNPIGQVQIREVRLSFANLFDPAKERKNPKTGEIIAGKYGCSFLMVKGLDTTKSNMAKLKAAAEEVKADKWGKKIPKLKPEKVFLRDGDLEDYDGYENCFYVSANNNNAPVLVDRKKDAKGKWVELTKQNGGPKLLYSGAFVNALVRIWAQDNEHGKRLNASVESVQFFKHGEAFSGGKPVDPNEAFDDIDEDEDADDDARLEDVDDDDLV